MLTCRDDLLDAGAHSRGVPRVLAQGPCKAIESWSINAREEPTRGAQPSVREGNDPITEPTLGYSKVGQQTKIVSATSSPVSLRYKAYQSKSARKKNPTAGGPDAGL